MLNEGQLNSGTDYDWLTQCHLFFLIITFDWEQHICDVYGCSVQRVGKECLSGILLKTQVGISPVKNVKVRWSWNYYGLLSGTVIFSRLISIQKLQDGSVVVLLRHPLHSPYWPGENIIPAKISPLQKYHPCKKESEILDRKITPAKSYERKIKLLNKSLHRVY